MESLAAGESPTSLYSQIRGLTSAILGVIAIGQQCCGKTVSLVKGWHIDKRGAVFEYEGLTRPFTLLASGLLQLCALSSCPFSCNER